MRLVQLTDTHIYADAGARFDGVDTRASLDAVLGAAQAVPGCDLMLLTGDLSMDGSDASYAWLEARLRDVATPVVAIPGNHDEPGAWPAARGGFGAVPATLEAGRWRLHLLDTRIPQQPHGRLGEAVLAWLESALAAAPDTHHVLFMHHPPLATGAGWIDAMGLLDADALWALLARSAPVAAIVCGHVHQNLDTWHRGTRVLTTPSTCVQFAPNSACYAVDARAPGFRVIDLGADGSVTTAVQRVRGWRP